MRGPLEGTGDFPGITLDLGDRWLDKIAASAAPSHSRIWDSYPKVRFAPDSPLEGGGFEPSVPRLRWSSVQLAARDATDATPERRSFASTSHDTDMVVTGTRR